MPLNEWAPLSGSHVMSTSRSHSLLRKKKYDQNKL
jgi:hypothetical protein